MNKFLNLLKPICKKFIDRKKEIHKIFSKPFDNAFYGVLNNYISKILLTLKFVIVFSQHWPIVKTRDFEVFQMLIPFIGTFWIFVLNGIEFTIITILILLKKQKLWLARLVLWLHTRIVYLLNNALSDNIFGLVLTNLILQTFLYNRNWDKFIIIWSTNPKNHTHFIMQLICFFVYTVIIPYLFCWLITLLSRFINVYSTTNTNEQH
jgi:hypothetical protein